MHGKRLAWVLLPVLLLATVLSAREGGRRWRASKIVATVEAIAVQAGSVGRMPARLMRANLDLLREAAELDPVEVRIPFTLAGLQVLAQNPEAAIRAYEEALKVEPRGEIYRNLGETQWAAEDRAAARESFRTALKLGRPGLVRELRKYLPEYGPGARKRRELQRRRRAEREGRSPAPPPPKPRTEKITFEDFESGEKNPDLRWVDGSYISGSNFESGKQDQRLIWADGSKEKQKQ